MRFISNVRETLNQQKQSYKIGEYLMSLFPDEDVLTKEIETWRGFIEKLPSEDDKAYIDEIIK